MRNHLVLMSPAWIATAVLLAVYALILTERVNPPIIALLFAGLLILLRVLDQDEAIRGIDFNTLALLMGTMVLVSIARRSGMFEALAIWAAKLGGAEPWRRLLILSWGTAVGSAFLD